MEPIGAIESSTHMLSQLGAIYLFSVMQEPPQPPKETLVGPPKIDQAERRIVLPIYNYF